MTLVIKDGLGSNQNLRTASQDGEVVNVSRNESLILSSQLQLTLNNGESIQTSYIDFQEISQYQVRYFSNEGGITFTQDSYESSAQDVTSNSEVKTQSLVQLTLPPRQRFIRFTVTNNTGSALTDVSLTVTGHYGASIGASTFPLDTQPQSFSSAVLTQSVITGLDTNGVYQNLAINTGRALLTSDFGTEVALGKVDNYKNNVKFGRNSDIDTGSTPEDVWNGGGDYTGFDITSAETLSISSNSASDSGSVVSSGTASGGSSTTLVDSGATFITDGVAVGDIVINDTQSVHGIVSEVTSQDTLTVYEFTNGNPLSEYPTASGDDYRVATATSTGAAVIRLNSSLDANYNSIVGYVVMNGTTDVITDKQYLRQTRATVELSGSNGNNVGEITANQTTTTANVTMVIPANGGQTAICCATVPAGEVWVVKNLQASMVRENGSAGSALMQFQIRERGGSWQTKRFPSISDSAPFSEKLNGGIVIKQWSDVRWRCEEVSDSNTQVSALFEYDILTV